MNFDLSDDQKAYQQAARQFAEKEMAPFAGEWDQKKIFPVDTIRKAGELGFLGVYTKPEFGGSGLSRMDGTIIFEELSSGCTSTTAYITIHNMVTWMVDSFCNDAVRSTFVPKLVTGELLGSYCLSEPNAGSDAGSLKTSAVKKGDSFVLNGSKAWVSGGGTTDLFVVMCRTGGPGPKGISAILVPPGTKGVSFGENEKKMGWNSQPTRIVNFDNAEVAAHNLLGEEGSGFKIAMKGLDGGRINIGSCSIGAAQNALTRAQKHLHDRHQFGQPLANFQGLQFKMADMVTQLVAARQMVRLAAYKLDQKDPNATAYCAMAKLFATEKGHLVCDEALQLFGGYGYTQEYPLERFVRDTRVHRILEGTNEIMRVIVARKVLDEGGTEALR